MSKHISFPSIGQYRQVIKAVNERASYAGRDEAGEPIYKMPTAPLPVLPYVGTIKLHALGLSYRHSSSN